MYGGAIAYWYYWILGNERGTCGYLPEEAARFAARQLIYYGARR